MDIQLTKTKLKERVAKGLNFGIEAMEDVLDPSAELFNEYVLLKSKYNDLMYMTSLNTMPYDQIEIALNRLRGNLIDMIDRIENDEVKGIQLTAGLTVNALPTRRDNFFRLTDIHFKNLEAICFTESYSDREKHYFGREAIYLFYCVHTQQFRHKENNDTPEGKEAILEYFRNYFSQESRGFEVYFNNLRHMLAYALESEVEQRFFLDTLRSLFSRYELALIFYYAFCNLDPDFSAVVKKIGFLPAGIAEILILPQHLEAFNAA